MGARKLSYHFPFLQGYKEINSVNTGLPNRHEVGNEYCYGFNGMEKDDEVAGEGNSYTAEFWQYDSRLGRRWNIDPVVKEHESPYATFANNPIWFADPNRADTLDVYRFQVQTMNTDGTTGWVAETVTQKRSYVGDDLVVNFFVYDKNGVLETAWSSFGFEEGSPESHALNLPSEYFVKKRGGYEKALKRNGQPALLPLWKLAPLSTRYNPNGEQTYNPYFARAKGAGGQFINLLFLLYIPLILILTVLLVQIGPMRD